MTSGQSGGSGTDFATARGRDWPSVRQFNVFLENRVGALLELVRRFESTDVAIISISIIDTADCAIIRLVLSDPERGYELLKSAKLMFTESDLVVVGLPSGSQPILKICKTLLSAEIGIDYAYSLLASTDGDRALALHVEDHETAVQLLTKSGFRVYSEQDLNERS